MFVLVDTGLHYIGRYMNERTQREVKLAKIRQERKDKKSKSLVKRLVSNYQNRGFAFSQEAGNDKLLTDSLAEATEQRRTPRNTNMRRVRDVSMNGSLHASS